MGGHIIAGSSKALCRQSKGLHLMDGAGTSKHSSAGMPSNTLQRHDHGGLCDCHQQPNGAPRCRSDYLVEQKTSYLTQRIPVCSCSQTKLMSSDLAELHAAYGSPLASHTSPRMITGERFVHPVHNPLRDFSSASGARGDTVEESG